MQKGVITLFCSLLFVSSVVSLSPGFKTILTQAGLDYLEQVGVQYLEQSLIPLTVPDQSGDAGTPIGHVDWTLTDINVTALTIGQGSITITPGTGLQLTLANINVVLGSNWSYRETAWPHVKDHGTAIVLVENTGIILNLQVTAQNGRPYLTVVDDTIIIGKLDIKLHGRASWLYDFFINLLKGSIRSSIEKSLTDAVTKNINNGLNKVLATLAVTTPLNSQVEVNFELTANPVFSPSYLDVYQLGEFYSTASPSECPAPYCVPYDFPDFVQTSEMVQMILSDFVFNSGSYVYWKLDFLNILVTDSEIPSWSPIRLNTADWGAIIPQLTAMYPNNLMTINAYSTNAPNVTFVSEGALVSATGELAFYVVLANGSSAHAFTLAGSASAEATAWISGELLYANMTYVSSIFTLKESDIGQFNPTLLDGLLSLFMERGVVPTANKYLAEGIQLPVVPGLSFVSPSIAWNPGYLTITTNIQYTPVTAMSNVRIN